MRGAGIPNFRAELVRKVHKLSDYNDDLAPDCFSQSKKAWAGAQRMGLSPEILNATSYEGHITKAIGADFPLPRGTPVPQEILTSSNWLGSSSLPEVTPFRENQLIRLRSLVADASAAQAEWGSLSPTSCQLASIAIRPAVSHQLLARAGLGGDRFIAQLVFGFPAVSFLSQEGFLPIPRRLNPRPPLSDVEARC